jgi:hypothetical protein
MLPTSDLKVADSSTLSEKENLIKSFSKVSTFYKDPTSSKSRASMYEEDQKIVFENLDPATSYTIRVNTIMNGIEIASKEAKIYQMG